MTDTVVEFVDKFVSSPAGRTKDVIPNLFTLIGYIVSLPTEKTRKLLCMEGELLVKNTATISKVAHKHELRHKAIDAAVK